VLCRACSFLAAQQKLARKFDSIPNTGQACELLRGPWSASQPDHPAKRGLCAHRADPPLEREQLNEAARSCRVIVRGGQAFRRSANFARQVHRAIFHSRRSVFQKMSPAGGTCRCVGVHPNGRLRPELWRTDFGEKTLKQFVSIPFILKTGSQTGAERLSKSLLACNERHRIVM
jgi:hypothetical protein